MMGVMVPETCRASNKICNKYHLLHLVGILFPHINGNARSESLQIYIYYCLCVGLLHLHLINQVLSLFVVEHWEGVKCFHPFLLLTSLFNFTPCLPTFIGFLFTVLLLMFLAHPCLLTPWGFQSSAKISIATFGFLSMWTICCHFLSLICCVTGCWLVVSYRSSFISLLAISCLISSIGIS